MVPAELDPIGFDHGVYASSTDHGQRHWSGITSVVSTWSAYFSMAAARIRSRKRHSAFNGTDPRRWRVDRSASTTRADTDPFVLTARRRCHDRCASTTVGQLADIAGGNDGNIAGQFAIDNLEVYNVAITDFSDRFTEGISSVAWQSR